MSQRTYLSLVSVVFALIAVLHALRLFYGWGAVIGGWTVPMALSWVALVVGGYLAWEGWKKR